MAVKKTAISKSTVCQRTSPKVTIIILNLNGWRDTIECLESLRRIDYGNYDIIVVDNGSQDESVERIEKYASGEVRPNSKHLKNRYPRMPMKLLDYARGELERDNFKIDLATPSRDRMFVIRNEENFGFAEGNNTAMRFALGSLTPDYVLLLNNDVVVDQSFLTELVRAAERESEIGIVGPKVYYYDFLGRNDVINFAGEDIVIWQGKGIRYGFNDVDKGQYDRVRIVDKIDGACILIRRALLEKVGLLDTDFSPIYWEETDLCIRSKREGFKVLYVPQSKIWHKISTSFGGSSSPSKEYFMTKNRFIFVRKNASIIKRLSFLFYFFMLDFWIHTLSLMNLNEKSLFLPFTRGVRDGLKEMMRLHSKRSVHIQQKIPG